MRLANRVAIITGSGSGNGRAMADAFAHQGAAVVCADLDRDRAEETAQEIKRVGGQALAVQMDHCDPGDCQRTVTETQATYDRLDILVNNAGTAVLGSLLDVSLNEWRRQFAINVLMSRAAVPALRAVGGGSIVFIGSSASLGAQPGGAAYVASKHALLGLARAASAEHAVDHIRVNVICPAVIDTPMAERLFVHRAGMRADMSGRGGTPYCRSVVPTRAPRPA